MPTSSRPLLLLCLALVLAPGCGGGGGGPADGPLHPLMVAANAYGAPQPEGAEAVTPEAFAALLETGAWTLVSASERQAQEDRLVAGEEEARQQVSTVFGNDPDLMTRLERNPDPKDPDRILQADGGVMYRAVKADAANGIPDHWVRLAGPRMSLPELVQAKQTYETRDNQFAIYEQVFNLLPDSYRQQHNLPPPEIVANEDFDYFVSLNGAIAADYQMFVAPCAPKPAPADYPMSRADEEGAGFGGDMRGNDVLPQGLWSQVDFPLKYCATRVRDQGRRNTCVFFSITAAVEARLAAQTGRWVNLSEQLFFNQDKKVWSPTDYWEGGWPQLQLRAMRTRNFVYPFEFRWDYNVCQERISDDDTMTFQRSCWADPTGSTRYAGEFCSETSHQSPMRCTVHGSELYCVTLDPGPLVSRDGISVGSAPVISHFDRRVANHPWAKLMLSLKVPLIYCYDVPDRDFDGGIVPFDDTNNTIIAAHASVLLGYIPNDCLPAGVPPGSGGGYYIGKNSWATWWGDNGYFYVSDDWVAKYLISMYAMLLVRD